MDPEDEWVGALLLDSLDYILQIKDECATPTDEWEDWWEAEDDPIGHDDPDDYMSEAEE